MTRVEDFREGDIVEYTGYHASPGRVSRLTTLVWVDFDGSTGGYRAESLRLLRRPVRVGDVVRLPDGVTRRADEQDCRLAALPNRAIPYWGNCTHADGTPIEPPKAEEKTAPLLKAENVRPVETEHRWKCTGCGLGARNGIATYDDKEIYCTPCITKGPAVLLPEHHIAHAIFETDPRVIAFVERASEVRYTDATGSTRPEYDEPLRRARAYAWERNLNGWRSDAEARASLVRGILCASDLQSEDK